MSRVVAITVVLLDAGLTAQLIEHWWGVPRRELDGRTPFQAVGAGPAWRDRALDLARTDAEELRREF